MDTIVDRYFPVVDALEEELDGLEDAIFEGQAARDTTERIYDLKRSLIALKRAVSPLIDVCNRLVRYDQGLIADECRPYFRDVYDHVVRINETVDNLRELLSSALEANLSLVGIRQNEVMKALAGWAAVLGVVTVMAGIWGMNFEFMPELKLAWGYPMALAGMAVVAALTYRRLKRAGWL
jgi:magnesium transporter